MNGVQENWRKILYKFRRNLAEKISSLDMQIRLATITQRSRRGEISLTGSLKVEKTDRGGRCKEMAVWKKTRPNVDAFENEEVEIWAKEYGWPLET